MIGSRLGFPMLCPAMGRVGVEVNSPLAQATVLPLFDAPPDRGGRNLQTGTESKFSTASVARRGGEHQRLDRDGNHFGDTQTLTDVDVIQVTDFNAVDSDDIARDFELVLEHGAQGFGDIEIEG